MKNPIRSVFCICMMLFPCLLSGCGNEPAVQSEAPAEEVKAEEAVTEASEDAVKEAETSLGYEQITHEEAKTIMDSESGYIILDVREQDEYDESHIPGAILMPYKSAEELAPSMLPDKDQLILVYCRSGRRSKIASETLAKIGYTNIREFGGIIDWQYETLSE